MSPIAYNSFKHNIFERFIYGLIIVISGVGEFFDPPESDELHESSATASCKLVHKGS